MTGPAPLTLPVLVSYAYGKDWDLAGERDRAARLGIRLRFMADSGAFTAHTTGRPVSLEGYASWVDQWGPDLFACAAPLDIIGDWQATATNVDRLRNRIGHRVNVLGVYHCGSPLYILTRQCATGDYVAIGGAVGRTGRTDAMMRLLALAHRTARDHGTVLHGFGVTVPNLVVGFPWMSVDSSYWTSAARTGTLALFDHRTGQWAKMRVGTRAPLRHAAIIRRYGGDPGSCARPGFGIIGDRGEVGRAERGWICRAGMLSWLRFAAYWRTVRDPIPPPLRAVLPGPTLYLAVGDLKELHLAVTTAVGDDVVRDLTGRARQLVS